MATSSATSAGVNATATQYNNLRTDAIRRDIVFQWEIEDDLAILDEQGGTYLVPYDCTIEKVTVWNESGTCTIRLQKGTSNILASQAVTSTATDVTTGIGLTALVAKDLLTLDIIGTNSGNHVIVQLFATRNL